MRKRLGFTAVVCAVALWALPGTATAAAVSCPNPLQAGQTNVYTVDPAIDCVWGNGNIGVGNPLNDDFLQGNGTNDAAYGDSGPTFGLTWTLVGSNANPGDPLNGATITNLTNQSATLTVTDTNYQFYAFGIKDGNAPQWAVFLLDSTQLSGILVSMTGGSFSHFVLYGAVPTTTTTTTDVGVSEPASLLLLGLGLALAGQRFRRRKLASMA